MGGKLAGGCAGLPTPNSGVTYWKLTGQEVLSGTAPWAGVKTNGKTPFIGVLGAWVKTIIPCAGSGVETLVNTFPELVGHGGALASGARVGQAKPCKGRDLGCEGRIGLCEGCRRRVTSLGRNCG